MPDQPAHPLNINNLKCLHIFPIGCDWILDIWIQRILSSSSDCQNSRIPRLKSNFSSILVSRSNYTCGMYAEDPTFIQCPFTWMDYIQESHTDKKILILQLQLLLKKKWKWIFRLFGNTLADELVVSAFVVPIPVMFLGLYTSGIQALIFCNFSRSLNRWTVNRALVD